MRVMAWLYDRDVRHWCSRCDREMWVWQRCPHHRPFGWYVHDVKLFMKRLGRKD
jgi:hypothetical protein